MTIIEKILNTIKTLTAKELPNLHGIVNRRPVDDYITLFTVDNITHSRRRKQQIKKLYKIFNRKHYKYIPTTPKTMSDILNEGLPVGYWRSII